MAKISAGSGSENYLIEIKSPSGNIVLADEPVAQGGQDKGFSPKELLAASLAACTNATIRIYVQRKGWDLQHVTVDVELIQEDNGVVFDRKIQLEGNLDDEQRKRIFAVANACPLHKILINQIGVTTSYR